MTARSWLVRAGGMILLLHVAIWICPALLYDDFDILPHAWNWESTATGLWIPQNEHTMPLGRLTTWLLVQLAPDPRVLAYLCALQGVVGILLALPLLYFFVTQELDSAPLGILASFLFGVSTIYQQAVVWFAASFSILALDTLLLALLAAQAWRKTGRGIYLDLSLLACLLAPGWFASGILAGPICVLYLLWPSSDVTRRWHAASLAPLIGSVLFLAIALPRVAATILNLPHYQGRSAVEAFRLEVGLLYTARSLVDNLLLGQVGITGICVPVWVVVVLLPLILGLFLAWVYPVSDKRLILLGLGLILMPYLLTYSARAAWDYSLSGFYTHTWNRYHLLPQLGVALIVVAGLGARLPNPEQKELSPVWNRWLGWTLLVLLVLHLPRGLLATPKAWDQWAAFARLAKVDARFQEAGVSRKAALDALPPWNEFPAAHEHFNGWLLLHGSSTPHEVPPEHIRQLID